MAAHIQGNYLDPEYYIVYNTQDISGTWMSRGRQQSLLDTHASTCVATGGNDHRSRRTRGSRQRNQHRQRKETRTLRRPTVDRHQ